MLCQGDAVADGKSEPAASQPSAGQPSERGYDCAWKQQVPRVDLSSDRLLLGTTASKAEEQKELCRTGSSWSDMERTGEKLFLTVYLCQLGRQW